MMRSTLSLPSPKESDLPELVFSARVFTEQLRLPNLTAWLNNANQA